MTSIGRRALPGRVTPALIALAALAGPAWASGPEQIGGRFALTPAQFYKVPVGDVPGHVVVLTKQMGKNASAEESPLLQGAQVVATNMTDEINDKFVQHGYVVLTASDGSALALAFDGDGTSKIVDNKLSFKGAGSWHFRSGTGRFSGGEARGTFKFEGAPEKSFVAWNGTFTPGEK